MKSSWLIFLNLKFGVMPKQIATHVIYKCVVNETHVDESLYYIPKQCTVLNFA